MATALLTVESTALHAFHLAATAAATGRRFCLHHAPQGRPVQGLVVYLHPFAEEMNKSRRMAALQSRALAAEGFAVLQIDLHGCGDSDGDFGDAVWSQWVDDAVDAAVWLMDCHGGEALPVWLWGLRVGGLLACAAAPRLPRCDGLLLWQPTLSGKQALQQFLRLKVASDMLSGQARGAGERLRQQLTAGDAVTVAGYALAPAMAAGLEAATLAPPPAHCRVVWLEVSASEPAELSPAASMAITRWREAGSVVAAQAVVGPSFWQTTEIEEAPALLPATISAVRTVSTPPTTAQATA